MCQVAKLQYPPYSTLSHFVPSLQFPGTPLLLLWLIICVAGIASHNHSSTYLSASCKELGGLANDCLTPASHTQEPIGGLRPVIRSHRGLVVPACRI